MEENLSGRSGKVESMEAKLIQISLRDRRILVVEDEFLIALSLTDALQNIGAVVVGPFSSIKRSMEAVDSNQKIVAAVLDINLGGTKSYPVANALIARKVPFIFAASYDGKDLRGRYPHVTSCHKPYRFIEIERKRWKPRWLPGFPTPP